MNTLQLNNDIKRGLHGVSAFTGFLAAKLPYKLCIFVFLTVNRQLMQKVTATIQNFSRGKTQ